MTDQLDFACVDCGSRDFIFPNKPPKDDDIISCAGCKRDIGRLDVIRKAIMDAGKSEMDKAASKAFGKNIKLDWK